VKKVQAALSENFQPERTSPYLSVKLRHRFSNLALDVQFNLTPPWTVLFGPSGVGKTSILRAIAGLLHADESHITLSGEVLEDTSRKVFLPAHRRNLGFVTQTPVLFPHHDVLGSIAFVLEQKISSHKEIADRAHHALKLFHADALAAKFPAALSGGERQRVALARAFAQNPSLLLLDEPFSGLDYTLRQSLMDDLQMALQQTRTPVLSVTHDLSEVFSLDAEVLVLEDGKLKAQGRAGEVLAEQHAQLLHLLNAARQNPA